MSFGLKLGVTIFVLIAGAVTLTTFERPPVISVQTGPRGLGIEQVFNPRFIETTVAPNVVPAGLPQLPDTGPRASQVYQNVQVLGDLSVGQFTRLMAAMTAWVSPQQGCNYCHVAGNLAAEDVYTKQVTRRMLQMVRHINENWRSHVGDTGVTCWTCHRGNNIPQNVWSTNPGTSRALGFAETQTGQNLGAPQVAYASLPFDPFTPFLSQDQNIRVITQRPLPGSNNSSIKQAEWTYGLMMHFSQALGVNCTYCHNSRSFADWDQSSPQRSVAWHGIRMVRDTNANYIDPLTPLWAANINGPQGALGGPRLGPHGDALKVNCTTCHQGAYKPMFGAQMARDYPELTRVRLTQ